MTLPNIQDPRSFDALHDDTPRWQALLEDLALRLDLQGPLQLLTDGTVLVAALGEGQVFKLFPPFLRDHWAFERGMLARLHGQLSVPTPELLRSGEVDGWGWLLMSRLSGRPLRDAWPALAEPQREGLLRQIGALTAELHCLPVGEQAQLAPSWGDFIARQRAGCRARQVRTGLPAHLLEGLEDFIAGPVPMGPDVLLTGEFTPMNLFVDEQGDKLAGMFDFGDGLVGPVAYDWGGPLCFLAAGQAGQVAAFFEGYGQPFDAAARLTQLRLLLLHRYSHLPIQLASCPGWEQAASLPELARRIWP